MSLNTAETSNRLKQLLKTKGTGPTMGKSLSQTELRELPDLLKNETLSLTTRTTLFTALLTLKPTPEESQWLQQVTENPAPFIPESLTVFLPQQQSNDRFTTLIKTIINHQELSQTDAKWCMEQLFDMTVPEHLKAAFLEAERLKRETQHENQYFFDVLMKKCSRKQSELPLLIDLSAAYDGFNRHLYLAPFIAMTLGKMGYPCLLHGMDEVSPKKGINSHKILKEMGLNPLKTLDEVVEDLQNPDMRWGYIDQQQFFPELYALKQLRINMIKRPFLATLEKLLSPITAKQTYCITGYTHPPYKNTMTELLKTHPFYTKTLIFRGTEGSMQLDSDRKSPFVRIENGEVTGADFIRPSDFGMPETEVEKNPDITVADCIREGMDALNGKQNTAKTIIDYQVKTILSLLQLS